MWGVGGGGGRKEIESVTIRKRNRLLPRETAEECRTVKLAASQSASPINSSYLCMALPALPHGPDRRPAVGPRPCCWQQYLQLHACLPRTTSPCGLADKADTCCLVQWRWSLVCLTCPAFTRLQSVSGGIKGPHEAGLLPATASAAAWQGACTLYWARGVISLSISDHGRTTCCSFTGVEY